ncbi:tryptophan halogenase [Sphingomonas gellani]|uniref:Tryptophan halogenase n=1 Tax=Sphingomonas gellani TaxID=1166340 RepID=A0A1H8AJQ5_9SPHN|nr:tryptophan halogenase family protein [Sphingomonas gellani]SEM71012.1 tryptophan halogenase [Sphingomonas gellani]
MSGPKRRVVVAGGGTAGWVAATALVKQLGPLVDVTLVESDAIGTVGVGESTIPTTRSFHDLIGVDESAFVRATGATFKLGISFENWLREGVRYFHPFGSIGRAMPLADFQHFWLEARAQGHGGNFIDYSAEALAAAERRFSADADAGLAYAYHLDATAYAAFLRGLAEAAGARRVEGRIAEVDQDGDTGDIRALVLDDGRRIEGDLFIDCTGFRALLIGGALKTGYEDWSGWLPTDSALAVQTEVVEPPVPFTRATAHRAGWRWRIPLQRRVGNGLVYASAEMAEEEARALLLGALDGAPLFDPRLIRFTTGMRRRMWNRNCVSLGLASGFIEPLESTSIHLVMIAVTHLLQSFPFGTETETLADRYNTRARAEWEDVRDFIILHYTLNDRPEPFWRRAATMDLPDSLTRRIRLFREHGMAHQDQDQLFRTDSWVQVMLGQGVMPTGHHRMPAAIPPGELRTALESLSAGIRRRVSAVPPHHQFLSRYRQAG